MWQYNYSDELKHYGVIGMKWGVRKNPSKAFAKASKKADKLNKKSTKLKYQYAKAAAKSSKAKYKTDKDAYRIAKDSILKPDEYTANKRALNSLKKNSKTQKLLAKSTKADLKEEKWKRSMSKAFSNVSVSDISDADIAVGRKYVDMLIK